MKADRNTLVLKRPASMFTDLHRTALPAGNGLTGAMLNGSVADEYVLINRHDLWFGGHRSGELPDISASLTSMREKIAEGKFTEANFMMANALNQSGFSEGCANPYPLCTLAIHREIYEAFRSYSRGIKLDRGELFTKWSCGDNKYERRLFVSRVDDTVYIHITGGGEEVYTLTRPDAPEPDNVRKMLDESIDMRVDAEKGYLFYCAAIEGVWAGAAAHICGNDIKIEASGNSLKVTGGDYTIMLKTFRDITPDKAYKLFCDRLCSSEGDVYRERLANNLIPYSLLYNSVSIELASKDEMKASNEELIDEAYNDKASPALIEKLWRYGRYLFISGTSNEGNPFPLYGLWHWQYNAPWAQNVANENVEIIYRHADTGGLSYAVKPLIKYYTAMTDIFEDNAKKLFGCQGIYIPAYTTPIGGGPSVNVPVILNWISCAGWLSQHFYNYYLYTEDRELLLSDILPFMYKTALFYEDYVSYDENGKIVICPSVSPENTPGNFMPENFKENMGHVCPAVRNAQMDISIMRELLTNLIEATKSVNVALYTKKLGTWEKMLAALPDFKINEDGAVSEWNDPELKDFYNHRHMSHLYGLFPGSEVLPDSSPELLDAFKKAVELRMLRGQCSWSLVHMACIYIRLGMGDKALDNIDLMCKGCLLDNFFTISNDYRNMGVSMNLGYFAPVQLDAVMGVVEDLQELCMRYANGTLYILPSVQNRFKNISVRDLRFPGGMVSFETGKDDRLTISVYASKNMPLRIAARGKVFDCQLECGKSYRFKA